MAAMKNYSSMEQPEIAAPPSANSVSTEATVAKMVIIKLSVIESCVLAYIFLRGILWRVWKRYSATLLKISTWLAKMK